MAELNPIAKQIHNISPDPVKLTLDNGIEAVFHISGAEFFQQEFQAEGTCENDNAQYRFVSSKDNEFIIVGQKIPDESSWSMVGAIVEVDAVESK